MADEYISKRLFNDAIREAVRRYPNTFYNGLETARQIAHDLPSADVQPVRHGRWFMRGGIWRCSECGQKALLRLSDATGGCREYEYYRANYCPNCGAKMDTKEQEAVYDPDKFFGRK